MQGDIPGPRREFSINTRRRRIAAIHNEVRKLIKPCDYVFLIEDDGVLPAAALSRLLGDNRLGARTAILCSEELPRYLGTHPCPIGCRY